MFPGLRFAHNHQRGFTLIELMIAIGIAALITGGITAAIMQILTINTRASNHMVAVRQVQQAGKEVSKDTLQAQNVTPGGCTNCLLSLNWTEVGGNQTTHQIKYTLVDKKLKREDLSLNSTTIVAEYIDDTIDPVTGKARTNCVWDGSVLTFTVTATLGTESETRIYEIQPRPDS